MKTKSQDLVIVDETNEYKKQRMLEVRSIVAKAVLNNQRVDLLGFEGSDIARSQIALQDLLTKEREKHARARGHILDGKDELDFTGFMVENMAHMIDLMSEALLDQTQRIVKMDQELKELYDRFYQVQSERDAFKTTLKHMVQQ